MISASAQARVGLLGNPSDGYGGRVIALSIPQLRAEVTLGAAAGSSGTESAPGVELLAATVTALRDGYPQLAADPGELSFTTNIPRQVGLSGSTAIIIAALRALALRTGHQWDYVELAKTALAVETDVLGWEAGPQDRVVIACEGLVDMDFSIPWNRDGYQRLDASKLPPLFIAWPQQVGSPSTEVHSNVRERWRQRDPAVVRAMSRFAELAGEGRRALDDSAAAQQWPQLMSEAFDLRQQMWTITSSDEQLVGIGSHLGAGVTLAGSGGAVVGAVAEASSLPTLAQAYADHNAGFLVINQ